MSNTEIERKMKNATKWSGFTEIVAKLISPITNMILARLLTPEIFGIVATVTMVFSFADMFTDAGFQKFIVQRQFKDKKELYQYSNVAFWTNLTFSLLFWGVIIVFSNEIAELVGCPGYGEIFIVACVSLPITSFSSIQMALYRRKFDFKRLFYVRLVGVMIPLIVTVPIAFFTHSYWALIIGTICGNLSNAIILMIKSEWKPKLFYNVKILQDMISFSCWSLLEALMVWLTNYIGVFIVGKYLSSYYLGLYKTSMSTVNQIIAIITATTSTVLFSTLARLQENDEEFKKTFYKFQRVASYFIVPLGFGIMLYRELITDILLGNQWKEAVGFVGLWALVSTIKVIYSNFCYEVYRAYGRPKLAVIAQVSQLIVLIPIIYYTARIGYEYLYVARSLVSLELVLVNLIIMQKKCGFKITKMISNTYYAYISSGVMIIVALLLQNISSNIIWKFISIGVCILSYIGSMYMFFPQRRKELRKIFHEIINIILRREKKKNR